MKLKISRFMLFVNDVPKVARFYRDTFGLKVVDEIDAAWTELDAGGCNIALHKISRSLKKKNVSSAKIVFGTKDVPGTKAMFEKKGLVMEKISTFEGIQICDGKDPEGNPFQISSRGMN